MGPPPRPRRWGSPMRPVHCLDPRGARKCPTLTSRGLLRHLFVRVLRSCPVSVIPLRARRWSILRWFRLGTRRVLVAPGRAGVRAVQAGQAGAMAAAAGSAVRPAQPCTPSRACRPAWKGFDSQAGGLLPAAGAFHLPQSCHGRTPSWPCCSPSVRRSPARLTDIAAMLLGSLI